MYELLAALASGRSYRRSYNGLIGRGPRERQLGLCNCTLCGVHVCVCVHAHARVIGKLARTGCSSRGVHWCQHGSFQYISLLNYTCTPYHHNHNEKEPNDKRHAHSPPRAQESFACVARRTPRAVWLIHSHVYPYTHKAPTLKEPASRAGGEVEREERRG